MSDARLVAIEPTVLLAGPPDSLSQMVRATVANPGAEMPALLRSESPAGASEIAITLAGCGESTHELPIPELTQPGEVRFTLRVGEAVADERVIAWQPPPHLRVHLVQHSHHDVGYTNLSSAVLREHVDFLDNALAMATVTNDYPPEARFRLVIEQAWSLQAYARRTSRDAGEHMARLLQRGDFELTALFGNMTTELCGPEELVRCLYPSQRLARRLGFPILTAEHNDVPGMSWGLAQVLTEAGIRLFCPQLPRYWSWCDPPMQGFWDERVLFPGGRPGGFWWEAPSGKRVLLWDNFGTGGDIIPSLPGLADRLRTLVAGGYPYEAVYWPVRGGARDNSPYILGFCDTARDWNAQWAWPKLIVSTNTMFHADLEPQLPPALPVFRGELPGQDYPVGSTSTAAATAVNRGNQRQLLVAERLATMAAGVTDHEVPQATLDEAYEDVLWYDEHTWGHHFPAGPAAAASEFEKQVHAYRAAALAHDATTRALARIADHIELPGEGFYLVVCNPLPHARTVPVVTPLREIENCGSVMAMSPEGYLRGVALQDRWHLHPPAEIIAGQFDLVDVSTGATVPFQMAEISADSPVPYAPQRYGLAQGGKRYGGMEVPNGLTRDLHFVATDLPPCGYKTYELRPRAVAPVPSARRGGLVIENEFYRIEADAGSGRIVSLIDIEADRDLTDATAPHGFGEVVVRDPECVLAPEGPRRWEVGESGPVYRSLQLTSAAPGHPQMRQVIGLHAGVKRIELGLRMLKEPTPLLDAHLAFPFALPDPRFRFESTLSLQTPPDDFLPGAFWDEVAVQNWVRVSGGGMSVLWSSLDAPMVALGRLTEGYTSPAHSCRIPERIHHPPGGPEQLAHGWLYSLLCAGNFGTNFAVSQTGSLLFRYSLTTQCGEMSDADAVRLGWEAATPCETIFTDRSRGKLPLASSLLSLDGDPLVLLACKPAESGEGLILRLWNPLAQDAETRVNVGFIRLREARIVAATEGEGGSGEVTACDEHGFSLRVPARGLTTVLISGDKEGPA